MMQSSSLIYPIIKDSCPSRQKTVSPLYRHLGGSHAYNTFQVLLVIHIRIDAPATFAMQIGDASSPDQGGELDLVKFKFEHKRREIFYIMRNDTRQEPDESRKSFVKSQQFFGLLDVEYLTIPRNGVEFFLLLLEDVEAKWIELTEKAKLHLSKIVNISWIDDEFLC